MHEYEVTHNINHFHHGMNDSIQEILSPEFDFIQLNESMMQEAVNGIAAVFGQVYPDVQELPYFNNMAMESIHIPEVFSHDSLLYNDNFMGHIANAYGHEAVIGIMAHEVGHALTNHFAANNGWELDDWQQELCADYIAGIYTRMAGINPEPMIRSFQEEAWAEDVTHPGGLIREKIFEEGFHLADQDPFLPFEMQDLHGILQHNIIDQYHQPTLEDFEAGNEYEKNEPVEKPHPNPSETVGSLAYTKHTDTFTEKFSGQGVKISFTGGAGICSFKCSRTGCLGMISASTPSDIDYSVGSQA